MRVISGSRTANFSLVVSVLAVAMMVGGVFVLSGVPAARAQSTVNVAIKGYAFSPSTITVVIGTNDTVTWANMDSVTHTVTSDTGAFNSGGLSSGQTFTHTFTTPGTYTYHCSIHTFMKGTVIVKGTGGTTSTPSTSSGSTAPSSSTTSTTSTPTTTSSSTTTPSTSIVPTSTSAPTTSTTPSGGGIPEFPYQGALVTVVTLAMVASYFVMRRSNKRGLPK